MLRRDVMGKAFDHIQPRRRGGCEKHVKSRARRSTSARRRRWYDVMWHVANTLSVDAAASSAVPAIDA